MNSIRERSDFAGSSSRKPVRLAQAGRATRLNALLEGEQGSGWRTQALEWTQHFRVLMRE